MGFLASTMVPATLIYRGRLMGGVFADYLWALFVAMGLGCLLVGIFFAPRYTGPGSIAIRLGLILQLVVYAVGSGLFLVMHRNP